MTGSKPKFAQINKGQTEICSNHRGVNPNFLKLHGVKFAMKVQNQKNLQITWTKKNYRVES